MRRLSPVLVLVLLGCGCSDGGSAEVSPGSTTTAGPGTGEEVVASSSTTSVAPAPDGAYLLPDAVRVEGEAPFVVAGLDTGVATAIEFIEWDDESVATDAPTGSTVSLLACSEPYPGLLRYDVEWSAPAGTEFPTTYTVALAVIFGDVGTGSAVDVTVDGPGAMTLIAPVPARYGKDESTVSLERDRSSLEGVNCQVEFTGERGARSEYVAFSEPDAELDLEVTAPEGSLERAIQQQLGPDAPLEPLQYGYATRTKYFADVMYLPSVDASLQSLTERIEADNVCLRLEYVYDIATVTQERGCGGFSRDGTWETGGLAFATGYGSGWNVLVSGADADSVETILEGLRPFSVLSRRPIPIVPGDQQLVGWVPFGGEDLLVTVGEQDCTGQCLSPEQFFYVYRVVDGGLERYAYYPAFGYCLLAEEEPWTLAIIDDGFIEIDRSNGLERIEGNRDSEMAVALVPRGDANSVRIVTSSGGEPGCLDHLPDPRGGIVDPTTSATTTTAVEFDADVTIQLEPCGYGPFDPDSLSSQPAIAMTCAKTPFGTFGLGRYVPDGEMFVQGGEPVPGAECVVYWQGNGEGGGPCIEETDTFAWGGGYSVDEDRNVAYTVGLVSEDTSRVTAITDRGERIVVIPDGRMVFLWWNADADLVSVIAETSHGSTDLLALGR